jgi:hypothetical protein
LRALLVTVVDPTLVVTQRHTACVSSGVLTAFADSFHERPCPGREWFADLLIVNVAGRSRHMKRRSASSAVDIVDGFSRSSTISPTQM